jgi:hypothetical protein
MVTHLYSFGRETATALRTHRTSFEMPDHFLARGAHGRYVE